MTITPTKNTYSTTTRDHKGNRIRNGSMLKGQRKPVGIWIEKNEAGLQYPGLVFLRSRYNQSRKCVIDQKYVKDNYNIINTEISDEMMAAGGHTLSSSERAEDGTNSTKFLRRFNGKGANDSMEAESGDTNGKGANERAKSLKNVIEGNEDFGRRVKRCLGQTENYQNEDVWNGQKTTMSGTDRKLPCQEWTENYHVRNGQKTTMSGMDRKQPCQEWTENYHVRNRQKTTMSGKDRKLACLARQKMPCLKETGNYHIERLTEDGVPVEKSRVTQEPAGPAVQVQGGTNNGNGKNDDGAKWKKINEDHKNKGSSMSTETPNGVLAVGGHAMGKPRTLKKIVKLFETGSLGDKSSLNTDQELSLKDGMETKSGLDGIEGHFEVRNCYGTCTTMDTGTGNLRMDGTFDENIGKLDNDMEVIEKRKKPIGKPDKIEVNVENDKDVIDFRERNQKIIYADIHEPRTAQEMFEKSGEEEVEDSVFCKDQQIRVEERITIFDAVGKKYQEDQQQELAVRTSEGMTVRGYAKIAELTGKENEGRSLQLQQKNSNLDEKIMWKPEKSAFKWGRRYSVPKPGPGDHGMRSWSVGQEGVEELEKTNRCNLAGKLNLFGWQDTPVRTLRASPLRNAHWSFEEHSLDTRGTDDL